MIANTQHSDTNNNKQDKLSKVSQKKTEMMLYPTLMVELNLQFCSKYRSVVTPEPAYSDKLIDNVPISLPPFW